MSKALGITVRDIKTAILAGWRNKRACYFAGSVGLGKSAVMRQSADMLLDVAIKENPQNKNYYESIRGNNFVLVSLANETPDKTHGVAIPVEVKTNGGDSYYRTDVALNTRYPTDPRWVGIICFDELSLAPPTQQSIAYQALQDFCIDTYKFPEGAAVCGAGNRTTDGGNVFELPAAIITRMRVYNVNAKTDVWVEDYALPNDVHPSIIHMVEENPEIIEQEDRQYRENKSLAVPRTLADFSNIIKDYEEGLYSYQFLRESGLGTIGDSAFASWVVSYELGNKVPRVADILAGKKPKFTPLEERRSQEGYLAAVCLAHVSKAMNNGAAIPEIKDMLNNIFLYFKRTVKMSETLLLGTAQRYTNRLDSLSRGKQQYAGLSDALLDDVDGCEELCNAFIEFRKIRQAAEL